MQRAGKNWEDLRMEVDGTIEEIMSSTRNEITASKDKISDEIALEIIEDAFFNNHHLDVFELREIEEIINQVFLGLRRDLDILDPFARDEEISEIMVNGKDDIFIEKRGRVERTTAYFRSSEQMEQVIRRLAASVHREINELNPIVDARMEDGSRINAVYKNIALNGPILTIRKFPKTAFLMENLIDMGTLTQECADFLEKMVRWGYNCFISGGTSSGKTTFLNILTNYIPAKERIVVIEDSAELQIDSLENVVRMECKTPNSEGRGGVFMDQLIKTSLRMRPDRIIVGEVRGKEVMDMINAMNTGHAGSLSTGHGNSISGMLRRLESMFLQAVDFPIEAIRGQIAEGIDIIIHLGRMGDGSRKILEIGEITVAKGGNIGINCLFKYDQSEGLMATGARIINREKMLLHGGEHEGL